MEYLKIKNWERHQHYKDRCPPWIKLHVKILNDLKFCSLSRASKCLLMLLWILASENDGFVPSDLTELKFRLRDDSISEDEINQLIKGGFLNNCKQLQADDSKRYPETETETDNIVTDFSSDSNEIRLSSLLYELMLQNNPNAKKPNFQSWAKSIDLMIRIDQRNIGDIEDVIRWCQSDDFWHVNILSTAKLRKQFDQLLLKMNGKKPGPKTRLEDVG